MTMAEAVAQLPHGFQIHRSHWVADTAIKDTRNDKVELVTGLSLPLSRHRRKAFDEWLDQITPA
jgi:DNA-binding LytR/AlgR family response regulator